VNESVRKEIHFKFEGRRFVAREGDTVAEALIRNGIKVFSLSNRYIRPRGYFCGDGTCNQCMMNIDGNNALACRTIIKENMNINRNVPKIKKLNSLSFLIHIPFIIYFMKNKLLKNKKIISRAIETNFSTDILIIGSGDSGISAFNTLKKLGINTILVSDFFPKDFNYSDYTINAKVFLIDDMVAYSSNSENLIKIKAKKIILATGSKNTDVVFENNDLPGIMTFQAFRRIILKGIIPGKEAVIIGSSGEEEKIANYIENHGIEIKGIVSKIPKVSKYKYFYYYEVEKAYGYSSIKKLKIKKGIFERILKCDLVILSDKTKNIDLIFNSKINYLKDKNSFFPVRNEDLSISDNIYYCSGFSENESIIEGQKAAMNALKSLSGGENENNVQIDGY